MEDILADPMSTPFNKEIDAALKPYLADLTTLLHDPESIPLARCPAGKYLSENNLSSATMIPNVGDLSYLDRARVTNWIQVRIVNTLEENISPHTWIGRLPLAHAFTILLASRLRFKIVLDPLFPASALPIEQELFTLESAWTHQVENVAKFAAWLEVDVERESLTQLELQMFERSDQAGASGYYQWGLDAGAHQDNWDPYLGLPAEWNHEDRNDSDSEIQVCCCISFHLWLDLNIHSVARSSLMIKVVSPANQ